MSGLPQRTEQAGVRLDEHLFVAQPVAEERVPEYACRHKLAPIE
ncbi:MAG TPA: hypothetical protein VK732_02120 [Verrucomicrobiae bacterium]|nr:hypothetical protein [Verrucomicrobiae bacterium]